MTEMTLRLNKIEEKVKTYLRQKLLPQPEMHVCVCFSGGVDSTVLLWMLYRFRNELGIRLSACHLNHMIRGEDADADERFCIRVCEELNIPIYCGRIDVPGLKELNGLSMEEAARDARYTWFGEIANVHQIDCMATAHHQNDQAETVLFRMIRGTTVSGLAGIPSARDIFIRPLLCLSKEEILFYANAFSLEYQTDVTNDSEQYTRNYIRQTVLPMLAKINPSVSDAIVRLSEYAAEDDALIASLLPAYDEVQYVYGLAPSVVRRVVTRNFGVYAGKTLCYRHLDEICNAAKSLCRKRIGLPGGYDAILSNGYLSFEREKQTPYVKIEDGVLKDGINYCCNGLVRMIVCKNIPSEILYYLSLCDSKNQIVYNLSTEILLSFEKICGMIRYRSRHEGDRLLLHGVNRSVKKLFSEKKIAVSLRQMIPVIFDDSGILCIPHVAVSDRVYADAQHATHYLRVDIFDEHNRKVVEEL